MRLRTWVSWVSCAFVLMAGFGFVFFAAQSRIAVAEEPGEAVAAHEGPPGLRVHVNPSTGAFDTPPLDEPHDIEEEQTSAPRQGSLSTEGLEELPARGPEYGVGIRLDERFRSNFEAQIREDGSVGVDCVRESSGGDAQP